MRWERFGSPGLWALILAMAWPVAIQGGEPASPDVDYLRDVKPILARRCVACHGPLRSKSGLRLDTAARIFKGGDVGPAVVPGKVDESPLLDVVAGVDGFRMPPESEGEAVPDAEVTLLRAWVAAGAKAPADEPEPVDPKSHWAFQPPVKPPLPVVKNAGWVRNPVDAILAARHQERGLTPTGPADPATLLRRVALDLTGIAPTPEELRAFLEDPSHDAYEAVVDRLLASPRYGERWGRHWMDVWRYSDWDGYGAEVRESQPHIWRWRDWIVNALNADKGYDRMVVSMLAADEATPGDDRELPATGYLARNWYKFNRNVWLDHIIEHTSKAFLGITLNCARCHDHKYDPIKQTDYYQFRAFFEPHQIRTDPVPGQPDVKKDGLARVYDAKEDEPTYLFQRGDEKDPDKSRTLPPGLPAVLTSAELALSPVKLPAESAHPILRESLRRDLLAERDAEVAAKEKALADAKTARGATKSKAEREVAIAKAERTAVEARIAADLAKLDATPPSPNADLLARLAAAAERRAEFLRQDSALATLDERLSELRETLKAKPDDARASKSLKELEAGRDKAVKAFDAAKAALAKDDGGYTPAAPSYPEVSTGRRLALARWIVSPTNPTAARVAVNHVWARHFGEPLVPTVTDFGLNGKPPTHPELLDWLAVEFMERGWSLKALHRLIVTSNAYQMSSTPVDDDQAAANRLADPANTHLWRMNPRRMEAEAVRDNVLAAAGSLLPAMGGPDLDPEKGLTDGHRSLYFRHAKEKRVTFLRLFDSPSVTSCYRRSESVVPQQALALANSPLTRAQARRLSASLDRSTGHETNPTPESDAAFIAAAFTRVLGREPTPDERAECLAYLSGRPRGRESLVHVLFNHNDFVTIR
ncbi:MAG: DUF1553 domain-containing protein [Isosphaeraceae bacterium]